jgi:hypothetical protein
MTSGDVMPNSPSVALHKTDPAVLQKNAQMISSAQGFVKTINSSSDGHIFWLY